MERAGVDAFAGRTFVVFGATCGIGRELCRRLAARRARVVAAGRDAARVAAMTGDGIEPVLEPVDARSFEQVEACLRAARDRAGEQGLAGVAHCVGSLLLEPAQTTTAAEWQDAIDTNLTTAFAVVRATAKVMRGGGSVVLCSSAAVAVGLAHHEAIAAAKAGIDGLVRAAAATGAPRGLRFHAVAPGLVRTPLAAGITGNPGTLARTERMHPLQRLGEPADVAAAIEWLLDHRNTWATGTVLRVDGGLAQVRAAERA